MKKIFCFLFLIISSMHLNIFSESISFGIAESTNEKHRGTGSGAMQDFTKVSIRDDIHFFGLYDGHGGIQISMYLRDHLHNSIFGSKAFKVNNIKKAIFDGFKQVDQQLQKINDELKKKESSKDFDYQGSCAVTVLVSNDKIYVANLGDSRAVLGRKPLDGAIDAVFISKEVDLSSNKKEASRIESLGGRLVESVQHPEDPLRVEGITMVTRAFGDFGVRSRKSQVDKRLIIAEPNIYSYNKSKDDKFIILASDGVWDIILNQEAVNIINNSLSKNPNPGVAAQDLVDKALAKGSMDNISVIVVKL